MVDYPYILLYCILMFLAYKYWYTKDEKFAKWGIGFAFVFIAFRAPVVGADTWDYVRYLTGERNFYNNDIRDLEVGFLVYHNILSSIHPSRMIVMLLNSIISLAPVYYLLRKYSNNIPLSILTFFIFDFYIVFFVGLRQVIGLSFLLWGYIFYLDTNKSLSKKIVVYLFASAIGFYFHTSTIIYSIIFAGVLFIPLSSRKSYLIIIITSLVMGVFLKALSITDIFDAYLRIGFDATERIDNYLLNFEENTEQQINTIIRLSIIGCFVYGYMDEAQLKHPFSKIFLVAIVFYNLFYTVPMIHRLIQPISLFGCFIITWTSGELLYNKDRKSSIYKFLLILLLLYFFRSQCIQCADWSPYNSGRLHPYYFIFEDYMDHPSVTIFG